MTVKPIAAIFLAVLLTGCAMSAVVYLQNMSGDMVRCGPYPESASNAAARAEIDRCVADYRSKGYDTLAGPRFIPETPPGF